MNQVETKTVTGLAELSHRDRRSMAIRFLRSSESMGSLLKRSVGLTSEAGAARNVLASVVYMVLRDAPSDLGMTDPALYARLRSRITDLRIGGWVPMDLEMQPVWPRH